MTALPLIRPGDKLLTPAEVAALLHVDVRTVTRWARTGKLRSIRTPGGHRRYSRAEIEGYYDRANES